MCVAVVRCQRSGDQPRCRWRPCSAMFPPGGSFGAGEVPGGGDPEQGHGRAVLPGERRPAAAERSPGRDTQGASGAFRSLRGACSTTEACSELLEVGFSNPN